MKPYIEIHQVSDYEHCVLVNYSAIGEAISDVEGHKINKNDLIEFMNADLPCDQHTKEDITNEIIKQYLTEKVL